MSKQGDKARAFIKEHQKDIGLTPTVFDPISKKKIPFTKSIYGICTKCEKAQVVPEHAWFRASKPKCKLCGYPLEPSQRAKEMDTRFRSDNPIESKEECPRCGCALNNKNKGPFCNPCHMALLKKGYAVKELPKLAEKMKSERMIVDETKS